MQMSAHVNKEGGPQTLKESNLVQLLDSWLFYLPVCQIDPKNYSFQKDRACIILEGWVAEMSITCFIDS